jgi:hypothetical protein
MNKEKLIEMGLTEEQATQVIKTRDGAFIPKHRFDEVNEGMKAAREQLKERDAQLDALNKSTGDVEALKQQIITLQQDNKAKAEAHESEIKQIRFDNALTSALTAGKARNPETVKPLLKTFLEKAELDGDSIKGLDAEIKKLVESDDTKYLFDTETKPGGKPGFVGIKPGESKDGAGSVGGTVTAGMSLGEAIKAQIGAQFGQNQN